MIPNEALYTVKDKEISKTEFYIGWLIVIICGIALFTIPSPLNWIAGIGAILTLAYLNRF